MRSFFHGCALIALVAGAPALAGVKEGVDSWLAGDFAKAVGEWKQPAADGNPDAQFNLGQAYKLGRGVPADAALSLDWYRKAAQSGHEQAQAMLGLQLFQTGKRDEAMAWLKKAAEKGEPRAQYVVGTAYFNGDSLPKDWARAYALMTRSKAAGIGAATTSLAQMDQLIPDAQKQAGLALAREMERTEALRAASDTDGGDTPLTMRTARTPATVGQTSVPPSTPAAPVAQASGQPWRAPAAVPAGTPAPAPAKTAAAETPPPAPKPVPKPAKPVAPIVASAGGGWKIQIGAFSNDDAAHRAWTTLSTKAPALKALSPNYVPAGAMVRLQAGPLGTRAAAGQACEAVKSAGSACFPVAP